MKDIKKNFNYITIGAMMIDVVFIVLGMFLIANPTVGLNSALMLIGIILLVSGLYAIVKYSINNKNIFKFELIYGIASIVIESLREYVKQGDLQEQIDVLRKRLDELEKKVQQIKK